MSCACRSSRDLATAGAKRGIRVQAIYGGRAFEPQVQSLQNGVEIVVGTPGRLLDLAQQGDLILGKVKVLVLDEADEMLDLGFLPDIERILAMVPDKRQTMLFSATMPGPIVTLSRSFMTQPTHIRAHGNDEGSTVPQTTQFIYRAHNLDKPELLSRVLQSRDRGLAMVFCRTKRTAQKVADELVDRGFAAAAVHGDLGQGAREQALRAFRSGKVDVLVATDVAARGIDVTGVSHVVNYQCPEDEKTYVHRIGRTGRAGSDRRRRHAGRLGRHPPLAADQQGARPRLRRPAGDVLHLAVGLHRPRRARRRHRPAAALAAHPRGPGRRDPRGPRRDRQAQPPGAVRRPRLRRPRLRRPRRLARPVRPSAPATASRPRRRQEPSAPPHPQHRRRRRGRGALPPPPARRRPPEGSARAAAARPRRRRRRGGADRGGGSESAA